MVFTPKQVPLISTYGCMKKSGFKMKSYEEMRDKIIARHGSLKGRRSKPPKSPLIGSRKVAKVQKGYEVPKWFKSIPVGSHGSTPFQKRYWKVVSNLVRQRDFKKYKGKCVSCDTRLTHWSEGQCAHWKAWSVCNGFAKYELLNLALSCASCNRLSDGQIGMRFGEELKRRYGKDVLDIIEARSNALRGTKMENWEIVERVEKLLEENPWFILP